MRAKEGIRESVHLNPTEESLLIANVLEECDAKGLLLDRSVTSDIRVANRSTADSTIHKAEKGTLKPVVLVESGQLVAHPVKTVVFGTFAGASTHEVDDFVSVLNLVKGFLNDSSPVLWVLVVILNRVRAIPKLAVKGKVLAKVVHPASATTLSNKILLDDVFEPCPSLGVSEVDHGKPDTETVDQKGIPILISNEVAVLATFAELILSDSFNLARVLNVGVDVDEGANAVLGPVTDHVVPVVVIVQFELPVPDESRTFLVCVLTNPVLHPDADHRQLELLHQSILLIDELLTTDDTDDGTLHGPLRQGFHCAHSLA